ncbi:hypothetical protein LCGC14_2733040 [marine sediment metagenome]|uniref:Gamma-glutamylcyclotransferase AIG2-like domain-containing protein n=1 Tax=marine sediment metagenome TaxID=412755 RepID=A0A0F8Z6T3_9ZZZZ
MKKAKNGRVNRARRDRTKPIAYVFGYGSLMYPSGINGRGMRHKYVWKDLSPAIIVGYKRGLFAAYAYNTFYGLMRDPARTTNGVLLPIFSKRDLNALWRNEGATKSCSMYRVKEVSASVSYTAHNIPVFALTNVEDRSIEGVTPPQYIANVWRGIEPWGEEFRRQFVNTGGIESNHASKMVSSLYSLYKPARYLWRNILRLS